MDQKTVIFAGCHVGNLSSNKLGKRQIVTTEGTQIHGALKNNKESNTNHTTQIK